MEYLEKIKSIKNLAKISQELEKQGKIIVTTNGAYDILHVGHIRSLQEAKNQGDVLIVGVNSDKSVRQYKSLDRPINDESDRAELVSALNCVDYVFVFDDENPIKFINIIKPNIHANSSDYGDDCVEKSTVEKAGGKIFLLKKYSEYSTTNTLNLILEKFCSLKK
ncbi:MAG: adenylyltransferase/cytidyltransferase family protein [bacterium]